MIVLRKFKAGDIEKMTQQEAMAYLGSYLTSGYSEALAQQDHSYTLENEEGRIVLCAGVIKHWVDRGEAWAIFDKDCKKHFVYLHNTTKRFLEVCPFNRVEATVDVGFRQGHRWMNMLGFKKEAKLLRKYRPDGTDAVLYARIK